MREIDFYHKLAYFACSHYKTEIGTVTEKFQRPRNALQVYIKDLLPACTCTVFDQLLDALLVFYASTDKSKYRKRYILLTAGQNFFMYYFKERQ